MYKVRGQNNIASTSIQTYDDDMETFQLNLVNEKRN